MTTRQPHDDDAPFGASDDASLDGFDDVIAIARSLRDEDFVLEEPPPDLWARIEREAARAAPPAPVALEPRRRTRWVRPALAAAAVLAVVGGITAVIASRDEAPDEIAVVDLSNQGLDPRGQSSHGSATVVRLADGRYALDVDVTDLPTDADGFFELWVIDPNVEGMVSLGPLRNGRVVLPAGVDPQAFPIVDISIEPVDGIPTHSGDSILRGVVQT